MREVPIRAEQVDAIDPMIAPVIAPVIALWHGELSQAKEQALEICRRQGIAIPQSASAQRRGEIAVSRALGCQLLAAVGQSASAEALSYSHSLRRGRGAELLAATALFGGAAADLEWLHRRRLPAAALARRAFPPPTDTGFVGGALSAGAAASADFLLLWTAREALLKALGLTLAQARRRLLVEVAADEWRLALDGDRLPQWNIAHCLPTEGLLLALAWQSATSASSPQILSADDQLRLQPLQTDWHFSPAAAIARMAL